MWSEISRRYVTSEPEFWWPEVWRKGSADIKQGSTEEEVSELEFARRGLSDVRVVERLARDAYTVLTRSHVAGEMARIVLPQNLYTEWHWTGSLLAWSRIWSLRVKPDAQRETRELVEQIDAPLSNHFPVAWEVLKNAAGN